MTQTPVVGKDCCFALNTGTVATPVWANLDGVGDVSISDFSRGLAELKRRGSDWVKNLATLIQSITIDVQMPHGVDQTNFDLIRGYFIAGTAMQYAIMNGPVETAGSEGWLIALLCNKFPWDQALEDVASHALGFAHAYMDESGVEVDPSWLIAS